MPRSKMVFFPFVALLGGAAASPLLSACAATCESLDDCPTGQNCAADGICVATERGLPAPDGGEGEGESGDDGDGACEENEMLSSPLSCEEDADWCDEDDNDLDGADLLVGWSFDEGDFFKIAVQTEAMPFCVGRQHDIKVNFGLDAPNPNPSGKSVIWGSGCNEDPPGVRLTSLGFVIASGRIPTFYPPEALFSGDGFELRECELIEIDEARGIVVLSIPATLADSTGAREQYTVESNYTGDCVNELQEIEPETALTFHASRGGRPDELSTTSLCELLP